LLVTDGAREQRVAVQPPANACQLPVLEHLAEAIARVRAAGHLGELVVRADSGFYSHRFVTACRRAGARFSVTVGVN
jgi:hypothetical protein